MSRVRSSMVLLGICVAALLIGGLRMASQATQQPPGSSYSAQPEGTTALYAWLESLGGAPRRILDVSADESPSTLIVLQPETPLTPDAIDAFDLVPAHGGTLVVAGDSFSWLLYTRRLGVTVEPSDPVNSGGSGATPDGLSIPATTHYRLRAEGARPLLVRPNGDWLALRMPYKQGTLVVLSTLGPLTNAALGDEQTARFVYREIVSPAIGQSVAFDEVHHAAAPAGRAPTTVNQLLLTTPPGRALMYAALLTFVYLLLSGHRLGPPVALAPPTETRRTMHEHVQMLANLYRRGRQLETVRSAFSRHYARMLARAGGASPKRAAALAEGVARVEGSRTESELIAAVAALDDAG